MMAQASVIPKAVLELAAHKYEAEARDWIAEKRAGGHRVIAGEMVEWLTCGRNGMGCWRRTFQRIS